ncbi:MAG: signal peptide peptidase SppA [Spirochaetaceae bacterium]|nr:MAG: signal peptide peptidase SppA [Spirochaetaceae bacterium]
MAYVTLVLSGTYREIEAGERSIATRLAERHAFHYSGFLAQLHAVRRRKRVRTLVIECREDFLPVYSAAAEAIRRDLAALRDSGIEIHFHAPRYSEATLYIASACNYRYIAPLGTVSLSGFGRTFLFFRRVLDRQGIHAEVFRRGAYKSAADPLRSDTLEPAARRQYQEYFDVQQREFNNTVSDSLCRSIAQIRELIDGRVLHDREAITEGWISEITTINELTERFKTTKNKPVRMRVRSSGYGRGKQVAVLALDGAIVEGKSRRDPLMGSAIGSRSIVRQITQLRENKRCAAVVVRINSPGGSAAASELIRHELLRLADRKPLVVSMSTVAASGGYWIATSAPLILAERTTLTGSIGVIGLIMTAPKLFKRLGITHQTLKTGPYRDLGSPLRAMSIDEKQLVEREIEYTYRRFLEIVAAARKLSVDHVHQIAQGRIWDGAEALRQRLVDEIGGLPQAMDRAAALASLSRPAVRFYPQYKPGLVDRLISSRSSTSLPGTIATLTHPAIDLGAAIDSLRRTPLAILPQALYSTVQSTVSSM